MEIFLLGLCLVSLLYCCDIPVIKGFEIFTNSHDSILYGVGLSIIAAYIFHVLQEVIPGFWHLHQMRDSAKRRVYDIELLMGKTLCLLIGEPYSSATVIPTEKVKKYLDETDIFEQNSKYEIQNHRELSVFEAIVYYDDDIIKLVNEILAGQYLERKYNKLFIKVKESKFHYVIGMWKNNLPGEYERRSKDRTKKMSKGYNWVNISVINSDIVSSIDEYRKIYNKIKKLRIKL